MSVSDIQAQIIQQANAQGVPSSIALGVAQQESGFNPNAVGSAGELGTFQLMPQYFPGAEDPDSNISMGVGYLAQLYKEFGDWGTALAAYNWGPGNVSSGKPWPNVVWNYVQSVLGIAGAHDSQAAMVAASPDDNSDTGASPSLSPSIVAPLALAGVVGVALWLAWS
jgi:soluble lytic murein transglycosylase-like protein